MNCVILRGNLTRDVELKTTQKGTNISRFNLAVRRDLKKEDGTYDSDFINCVAYGNLAEVIAKYHHKGSSIIIEGRIQTGSYEDEEGNRRFTTDVVVNKIHFDRNNNEKKEEPKEEKIEISGLENMNDAEIVAKALENDDNYELPF